LKGRYRLKNRFIKADKVKIGKQKGLERTSVCLKKFAKIAKKLKKTLEKPLNIAKMKASS
jgi:hypothetical protein